MLKSLMVAAIAIMLPGVAAAAVTYDLTLTDAANPTYSGTGSLTLDSAPALTGLTDYSAAQVLDLSFTIDGQTFTTALPHSLNVVRFLDGQLNDITFSEQIGANPNRFALSTTSGYAFYYDNEGSVATGSISARLASAAASPTPEPSTWAMTIIGFGLAGAAIRRRRGVTPSAA